MVHLNWPIAFVNDSCNAAWIHCVSQSCKISILPLHFWTIINSNNKSLVISHIKSSQSTYRYRKESRFSPTFLSRDPVWLWFSFNRETVWRLFHRAYVFVSFRTHNFIRLLRRPRLVRSDDAQECVERSIIQSRLFAIRPGVRSVDELRLTAGPISIFLHSSTSRRTW